MIIIEEKSIRDFLEKAIGKELNLNCGTDASYYLSEKIHVFQDGLAEGEDVVFKYEDTLSRGFPHKVSVYCRYEVENYDDLKFLLKRKTLEITELKE